MHIYCIKKFIRLAYRIWAGGIEWMRMQGRSESRQEGNTFPSVNSF